MEANARDLTGAMRRDRSIHERIKREFTIGERRDGIVSRLAERASIAPN